MNSKTLRFSRWFPCGCLTMVLFLGVFFVFFAIMQVIDEHGYASDFNNIPGIKDDKIVSTCVKIENDLFFCRIGWLDYWGLHIIGKFTYETTSYLLSRPGEIGFPIPQISYEEEIPINLASWKLKNVPKVIEHNLKLTQSHGGKYYFSQIDDNLVIFNIDYKKHYQVRVFLLGKSGYFIMEVIHFT